MTDRQKISEKKSWTVTEYNRINILNSTYRQALTYICQLKNFKIKDVLNKPIQK